MKRTVIALMIAFAATNVCAQDKEVAEDIRASAAELKKQVDRLKGLVNQLQKQNKKLSDDLEDATRLAEKWELRWRRTLDDFDDWKRNTQAELQQISIFLSDSTVVSMVEEVLSRAYNGKVPMNHPVARFARKQ